MSVKTSKQLANEWEVSECTVSDWCKKGKILGAIKVGRYLQLKNCLKIRVS